LTGTDIYLYQDVPYATEYPWHTEQIEKALTAAGGVLRRVPVDVADAFPMKQRLLAVFGSQFKPSYMLPKVEACAHAVMNSKARYGELLLRIERFPSHIDEADLYSGHRFVKDVQRQLKGWFPHAQHARSIRILCPVGVGDWRHDSEFLLQTFPDAVLEVHLTSDTLAETEELVSPRIRVVPVQPTIGAWTTKLFQIVFSKPHPVIIVTSFGLAKYAPLARLLFAFSRPLTVATMDHLCLALAGEMNRWK
jgi:hypothetical protein